MFASCWLHVPTKNASVRYLYVGYESSPDIGLQMRRSVTSPDVGISTLLRPTSKYWFGPQPSRSAVLVQRIPDGGIRRMA